VRKKTDTQTNGGKNPTPAVGVGNNKNRIKAKEAMNTEDPAQVRECCVAGTRQCTVQRSL